MAELFDHIDQLRGRGGRVAIATLVNTQGTTPRKEGAKMLVGEGGAVLGSVTIGGCVDARVIEEAGDVLSSMRPQLLEMNLGDEEAWEIGLTCGGTIEVLLEPVALDRTDDITARLYERVRAHAAAGGRGAFLDQRFAGEARDAMARGASRTLFLENVRAFVEVFAPPAQLIVIGAGHVAMPLTTLARTLGYRTIVLDGRPRFATRERFPGVDELHVGIPSELIRNYPL